MAERDALKAQEPVAWMVTACDWYAPVVQLNKPTSILKHESSQPLFLATGAQVQEHLKLLN